MKLLEDCFGKQVRLSVERMAHILEHFEMSSMGLEVENVLREPTLVRRSRSDDSVSLFCFTDFTPKHLLVANGCALWLNTAKAMRLW